MTEYGTEPGPASRRPPGLASVADALAIETPAFVYDEAELAESCRFAAKVARQAGCRLCYSLKACSIPAVVERIVPWVEGLCCASPFEARLACQLRSPGQTVHFTSPCIRPVDVAALGERCDYVSFNSLSQWQRFGGELGQGVQCGIRLNPEMSVLDDVRYDPCRPCSKLGVPISAMAELLSDEPGAIDGVTGVHFHTGCDHESFEPLLRTVEHIDGRLGKLIEKLQWVNLGGGYLFEEEVQPEPLRRAVELLNRKYGVEVFIEPGAGLVRSAGLLVASVVDLFESGGRSVAVLDTTVNHMPEVFEYQYQPDLANAVENGDNVYLLAGASCLAGDVFGEYRFAEPLRLGQRLVIEEAGAYALVKAHRFNGVNLPGVWFYRPDGLVSRQKSYGYPEFVSKCGGDRDVTE